MAVQLLDTLSIAGNQAGYQKRTFVLIVSEFIFTNPCNALSPAQLFIMQEALECGRPHSPYPSTFFLDAVLEVQAPHLGVKTT